MPTISQNSKGGSILFDQNDWLAGLDTTTETDYPKFGLNNMMSKISPFRQYGYLAPSPLPTLVTNNAEVTGVPRNAVVNSDNAYIVCKNSLIHKLSTLSGGTISTTSPFPHTISHGAHTSITGDDIAVYFTGTTKRVFYSFNDNTDWDVGIYNIVADTFDDDFMSTVPASPLAAPYLADGLGYPHPVIVGDDDILYIGDRNYVHAYDGQTGANGTFYPAVLTLPKGWIITCFSSTQDINLAIGAYFQSSTNYSSTYNRGSAKVWVWNYLALDPDYSRDLKDNYVSEIIQWNNTIAAFTSGRRTLYNSGVNKLQALNGSEFEVMQSWNSGGLPLRGGVDIAGTDIYWNSGGHIYSFVKRPDNGRYTFNRISGDPTAESGLMKFLTASGIIHYSYSASLYYMNSSYDYDSTFISSIAQPAFDVRQMGRVKSVTVCFKNTFTGGRSFRIDTLLDGAGGVSTSGTITASTNNRIKTFLTKADGTPIGDFNFLQTQLVFPPGSAATSSPIVSWVRYDFETVNVKTD